MSQAQLKPVLFLQAQPQLAPVAGAPRRPEGASPSGPGTTKTCRSPWCPLPPHPPGQTAAQLQVQVLMRQLLVTGAGGFRALITTSRLTWKDPQVCFGSLTGLWRWYPG